MKKLVCIILSIAMFATLAIVPASGASSKADIEAEMKIQNNIMAKIHEAAELLRSVGYSDDTTAINVLKNDYMYVHAKYAELQKELNNIIANEPKGPVAPPTTWTGRKLTRTAGRIQGPNGPETYYNLNMSGVIRIMRNRGYDATNYPYWVRDDGMKMLGPYIMAAANLNHWPRGSIVESSRGFCIICDTGYLSWNQLDLAVIW